MAYAEMAMHSLTPFLTISVIKSSVFLCCWLDDRRASDL